MMRNKLVGMLGYGVSHYLLHRLGRDEDSVPTHERNYSKTLFACLGWGKLPS
jgi:hypothetical protein